MNFVPERVHVVAGGESSRLRQYMLDLGLHPDYPKHLLPTGHPNDEVLAGRIIRQADDVPVERPPVLHVNERNERFFRDHADIDRTVEVVVRRHANLLMPMVEPLLDTERRVVGAAADFFASDYWPGLLNHHESHPFPFTLTIARSVAVDEGLAFDIADNGKVRGMERLPRTDPEQPIHLGVFIIDPDRAVLDGIKEVLARSPQPSGEAIVARLIALGKVGAYQVPNLAFNVNTPETHQALLAHTTADQMVA